MSALLLTPLLVFLLAFFVLPFGVMLYQSLYLSLLQSPAGSPMTFANYTKAFGDAFYVRVLLQTVALVVSIVIRSYGWMVLLGRAGTVNTLLQALGIVEKPLPLMYNWFGVTVALVHVLLPFMILTLASVIEGIPESLEDTAAVLGAGWWERFRYVVLPLSMEGVGAGITLVLMLTIGSFVSVLLLGGSDTLILPLLIYQQVILLNNNFAAALGMLLLGISVVLLYVQARAFRIRGAA